MFKGVIFDDRGVFMRWRTSGLEVYKILLAAIGVGDGTNQRYH